MPAYMTPPMKHCPDCKAPNPPARTECFSCGQSLDKKAAPVLGGDLRTFSCTNCAAPVSFASGVCSACGRVSAPPLPPTAAPFQPGLADAVGRSSLAPLPPPGWETEPLPDGTVLLRRTFGGRLLRDANLPAFLFCVAGFTGLHLLPGRHGASSYPLLWAAIALSALLAALLTCLWAFASQEELRAGQNALTSVRRLGGYQRTWRVSGQATLRVKTNMTGSEWGRYGTQTKRTLYAEQGKRSQPIDFRIIDRRHYGINQVTLPELLSDARGGGFGTDDMTTLARYLSAQTGWSVSSDGEWNPRL